MVIVVVLPILNEDPIGNTTGYQLVPTIPLDKDEWKTVTNKSSGR